MRRVLGWLGILALALTGQWYDSTPLRAACVPALVVLLALAAPSSMRAALFALAAATLVPIALGHGDALLDATPALVAALVGWLFARTLLRGRRPLIARAIAAIDGPEQLDDPAVARYARRLTRLWALYQFLLAAIALLLALRLWCGVQAWDALPGPRMFGVFVLPLAVAALALGEFALRPYLLPQAPARRLFAFVADLVRAWPKILND